MTWLPRLAQASEGARSFDMLFIVLVLFSCGIVLLVGVLVVVFSVRFRSGSKVSRKRVPRLLAYQIEALWIALTFFAAMVFFWIAGSVMVRQLDPPEDAMEVHVEAKQWMWKASHAGGAREINALHVPAGQPVKLYLNSQDVIHSFFVPAFRLKQDVVPGRTATAWFTATEPGTYHLFCAEFCGTSHSQMTGRIVVMEPDDFARWLAGRPEGETLVAEGRALFTSAGCSGCHAKESNVHAPDLRGLAGRRVALADGRVVVADDAYLRDSILLPGRDIVAGYEPVMPDFSNILNSGEVTALVAYLRHLGAAATPAEDNP